MNAAKTLSEHLAEFAAGTRFDAIPGDVRRWGKLLMVDAVGNAYASTRFEFAHKAFSALRAFDGGRFCVIGMPERLALRDAVTINGVLVHGLDYDDSYLPAAQHLTGSCMPPALALAERTGASGEEMLTAYLLGLEAGARIGAVSKGSFVKAGFHPTSLVGAFAASLVAGRLMRLPRPQLVMAQGMALSFASGTMQATQEGTWAKRMHAGWAGAAGVTAASLAHEGYTAPSAAYEGKYGLFPCFLGAHAADADPALATRSLGEAWEVSRISVKLYPACYQSHAFMNAAIELARDEAIDVAQIDSIRTLVTEAAVPLICEPLDAKRRPHNSYAAQFSLPYALACCLARGRFGLDETEEASYSDAALLDLAGKVSYSIDPNSGFPKYRSGEVIIRMKDGKEHSRRRNLYPDDQLPEAAVIAKFMDNTKHALAPAEASRLADMIMHIEDLRDVQSLTTALGARRAGAV